MPLAQQDLDQIRRRVFAMLMDTVESFEAISESADEIYGARAGWIRNLIKECLDDFVRDTSRSGEEHPETAIYKASREKFQRAGFYGYQLDTKEGLLTSANRTLRARLAEGTGRLFRRSFKKWVDIINNFLGSLIAATGFGEALKELKDCLRDELPEDET